MLDILGALSFATGAAEELLSIVEKWKKAFEEKCDQARALESELDRLKNQAAERGNWSVQINRFVIESSFAKAQREEIDRARKELAYPPMASLHEGYSVILEELDEFWEEIRKKPLERNVEAMWKELVQVAAMAQRTAEDLKLGGGE